MDNTLYDDYEDSGDSGNGILDWAKFGFGATQQVIAQATTPPAGYHYDPVAKTYVPNVGLFSQGTGGILILVAVVAVLLLRK